MEDVFFRPGQHQRVLSGELDLRVIEKLAQQPLDEGLEGLAGFCEKEDALLGGPVKFEAGGLGGDPKLADGSLRGEDELYRVDPQRGC